MLSIASKTTPTYPVSIFIHYFCFTPLHCQKEITVVGIDAMLHLRPEKNPDWLVVHIDGFAIRGHVC